MEDMSIYKIVEQMARERNINTKTKKDYLAAIRKYCEFHGKPIEELFEEADIEEEEGKRWKYCKLRNRLIDYRTYLFDNFAATTAKSYFRRVKTVYTHFDFDIRSLPAINIKSKEEDAIRHSDLPTKDLISHVLKVCDGRLKAIILFMVSSGSSRAESCSLTVKDFLEATEEYSKSKTIRGHLHDIWLRDDVVPTFHMYRSKTRHHYYTFCTPEASQAIAGNLLLNCNHIKRDTPLFLQIIETVTRKFIELNNKLELGKVKRYTRFRPHMLRKYNASALFNDGMTKDDVDSIQGRVRKKTEAAYFLDDPQVMKKKYVEHMGSVMIDYDYHQINYASDEYRELVRERDDLIVENHQKDKQIQHLQELLGEREHGLSKY